MRRPPSGSMFAVPKSRAHTSIWLALGALDRSLCAVHAGDLSLAAKETAMLEYWLREE
jgi:hypothetical protein